MGVDTHLYLPGNARIETVAKVAAKLLGVPARKVRLDYESWYADMSPGAIKYRTSDEVPGMASVAIVDIDHKTLGHTRLAFNYHFESERQGGSCRLVSARATALTIALFCHLTDFFGGIVDFNDCDGSEEDYKILAKDDSKNCPTDGQEWQNLQERIIAVAPLTPEQLAEAEQHTAY